MHFHAYAEAKQSLIDTIKTMRETLQDPEKVQGKLSKEDKVRPSTYQLITKRVLPRSCLIIAIYPIYHVYSEMSEQTREKQANLGQ